MLFVSVLRRVSSIKGGNPCLFDPSAELSPHLPLKLLAPEISTYPNGTWCTFFSPKIGQNPNRCINSANTGITVFTYYYTIAASSRCYCFLFSAVLVSSKTPYSDVVSFARKKKIVDVAFYKERDGKSVQLLDFLFDCS